MILYNHNQSIDDACKGMCRGVVKFFNEKEGFGFINRLDPNTGKPDSDMVYIFVHFDMISMRGYKTLKDNEIVYFTWIDTIKGLRAVTVLPTGSHYEVFRHQ